MNLPLQIQQKPEMRGRHLDVVTSNACPGYVGGRFKPANRESEEEVDRDCMFKVLDIVG
jgi:hypothetical protein